MPRTRLIPFAEISHVEILALPFGERLRLRMVSGSRMMLMMRDPGAFRNHLEDALAQYHGEQSGGEFRMQRYGAVVDAPDAGRLRTISDADAANRKPQGATHPAERRPGNRNRRRPALRTIAHLRQLHRKPRHAVRRRSPQRPPANGRPCMPSANAPPQGATHWPTTPARAAHPTARTLTSTPAAPASAMNATARPARTSPQLSAARGVPASSRACALNALLRRL